MKSAIQLTTAGFFPAGLPRSQPPARQIAAPTATIDKTTGPLPRLLAAEGLVGADEAREIGGAVPAQQRIRLAQVLRKKGAQSEADLLEVVGSAPAAGWNNPSPAWIAPVEPPVITSALPISPTAPAPAATPAPLAANKTGDVVPAVGWIHPFGGSRNVKLPAETAVVLSGFGDTPSNVADQPGFGERQGADSGGPEIQGRIVAEWQFDKAPGVVPAQIVTSFVQASRKAHIKAADVPAAFITAFPNGGEVSALRYGCTVELQLATRAATFTAKYFNSQDPRFYFVGGLYSNFNFAYGLTGQASALSIDGASTVIFGMKNGLPVIAPRRPVGTQGYSTDLGLPDLGLPLSRWFDAKSGTRPAGSPANMSYSIDMVPAGDARRMPGVARQERSGSLHPYAANSSATDFGGLFPLRGIPSRQWHDIRTEIGPVFTF